MGIKKKVGIGFGIVVLSFIVLVIISQVWMASLTPEERQRLEDKRTAEELSEKQSEQEKMELQEKESESYQPATIGGVQMESGVSYKVSEDGATKIVGDNQLSTEDMQKIVGGFESYNKSVKMLLDMCVDVETEDDFRLLGLLIAEHGDGFLENTSSYGAVRAKLIAEGYGEHPVLGPLLSESENLVNRMSTCMEMLAWEFSG